MTTWSRAPGQVRSTASSSSPERDGRRARLAAVLVGAGVGDDQRLARRDHRVEQQLAVLAARVALAGERVAGQHVVAVGDRAAREDAVVEAHQADHPVRHRPHRHQRGDGEVAGAEVGPGGARLGALLQQGAHVGQPQLGGPPVAASRSAVDLTLELRHLPLLRRPASRPGRGRRRAARSATTPGSRRAAARRRRRSSRETSSARRPASPTWALPTSSSGSTAARLRPSLSAIATPSRIRSRPARQVFWSKPSSRYAARCSSVRPHRTPDCSTQARQRGHVVVGEPEPVTHRRRGGQVEDLAGLAPAAGERHQRRRQREQRVGAQQAAVGQPHPQPVGRVGLRSGRLAQPEGGREQRRVGLDVGAHHEDVARLERVVGVGRVLHQPDQHLPQHLHLPGRPVAGVDLDRPVVGVEGAGGGRAARAS